jgi:uncharacterized membrane protein
MPSDRPAIEVIGIGRRDPKTTGWLIRDVSFAVKIAAVCTIVQLLLIGLVLEWVFRLDRWYVVVAMMSFSRPSKPV